MRDEDRRGRERSRADAVRDAVTKLRPGEVIHVPQAKRRGLAVVVSSRDGKPTVLSQDRTFFRLTAKDFDEPPVVLTRIALPRSGSSPQCSVPARRRGQARLAPREAAEGVGPPRGPARGTRGRQARGTRRARTRATPVPSSPSTFAGPSARTRSSSSSAASSAGSGCARKPSPASSTGCSRCSRPSGTSTAGRSPTRGGRCRGSTGRATCSWASRWARRCSTT